MASEPPTEPEPVATEGESILARAAAAQELERVKVAVYLAEKQRQQQSAVMRDLERILGSPVSDDMVTMSTHEPHNPVFTIRIEGLTFECRADRYSTERGRSSISQFIPNRGRHTVTAISDIKAP